MLGLGDGVGPLSMVPLMGSGMMLLGLVHRGIWQQTGSLGSGTHTQVGAMLLYDGHLKVETFTSMKPC